MPAERPRRIVIADDDLDCRELVTHALETDDTVVVAAADGGELLEQIAGDAPIDLVVTDINMPWMEGLQVLASIREAGLEAPVLVITGLSRPDLEQAIGRMGNARLLHKPFGIDQLRRAVAALLDQSDAPGSPASGSPGSEPEPSR